MQNICPTQALCYYYTEMKDLSWNARWWTLDKMLSFLNVNEKLLPGLLNDQSVNDRIQTAKASDALRYKHCKIKIDTLF